MEASQQPDVLRSVQEQLEQVGINPNTQLTTEQRENAAKTPVQCREGVVPLKEKRRQRRNLQHMKDLQQRAAEAG